MTGQGASPQQSIAPAVLPSTCVVQLRYATLPHFLRAIAVHYWFVVFDPVARQGQRWEVWQAKDAGGKSMGHVHCDLRHPDCGVGGGDYRLAAEWSGGAARAICAVLHNAQNYPHRDRYRAWPGPNSNTFAAWVLREAGLHHAFDPRAIGKDYGGLLGMKLSSRPAGVQVETALLGVRLSHDGVEVHLLSFTCGVRWSPLEVYTPFGRLGFLKTAAPLQSAYFDETHWRFEMKDTFTPHYLTDAVRQFRGLKALAERAMAQIGDEDLFTALDEEANSIAALLKHMAGSMRARWTDFPTMADGGPDRDRDSEFMISQGDAKRTLIEQWEAGWQRLFDALERLTTEDMAKSVLIRGESLSVIEAINRQLTHYAYHVGQIVFLAKHFRSGAWQSLSIPRGKSKEFTTPRPSTRSPG